MQPQEPKIFTLLSRTAPSAALGWFGTELVSFLQLIFFLALGYAVTRTWIWSRGVAGKALTKKTKLDDLDQALEEIQGTSCSESDGSPVSKSKATGRKSNALERKRNKKANEAPTEKLRHSNNGHEELHATPPAQVDAPQETTQEVVQEPPQEAPQEAAQEAPQEAPQEVLPEEPQEEVVSERVARMMAKKMERKAKKAREKTLSEDKPCEDENKPDIVATADAKSDAEALSDDMAQTTSAPSVVPPLVFPQAEPVEHPSNEELAEPEETPMEKVSEAVMHKDLPSSDTLDNMDTDTHSESDDICVPTSSPDGISTPEQCLTPRVGSTDALTWCMPQVPQIDGMPQIQYMAVAVPAEYAPAGAPGPFDGLWKNAESERIVIDHEEILFESGMKWVMKMQSLANLTVNVGGEEFHAELDPTSQTLQWSDGDIWTCVGQTDAQQRWAAQRQADGMPCFLCDGEQYFPMNPMTMEVPMVVEAPAPAMPKNMVIPQDAKSWEVCWDWSKKGWCKRGSACEWYHPPQPPQQFQNCNGSDAAAPFSEFMETPFAGPIY